MRGEFYGKKHYRPNNRANDFRESKKKNYHDEFGDF